MLAKKKATATSHELASTKAVLADMAARSESREEIFDKAGARERKLVRTNRKLRKKQARVTTEGKVLTDRIDASEGDVRSHG